MWNKFLRNPLHIVKDYELRKLLWQSGGGTAAVSYTHLDVYKRQSECRILSHLSGRKLWNQRL